MKDTEFAYAVARIRSNENKLLSSANIEALINSSDYKEAIKILSDSGYDNIVGIGEEVALVTVLKNAFELIYTSAPDKKCLDFLIIKNDFHNIKAIIKSMVVRRDYDNLLLSPSVVDSSVIAEALDNKDYSSLPEYLSDTVREAYDLVTLTMDGQLLEIFLDRKCIEAVVSLARESKDEFAISLADLMCAVFDIKVAVRCLKTDKDENFIDKALAECSLLDTERLKSCILVGEDTLYGYISSIGFENLAESARKGYASFEKNCDDLLMDKIKFAKYQCLGIAPLVAYYFAVDAEVKTVRIILSCKRNGIDAESIRERVRKLYV